MCVAECPPIRDTDTMTVRMVKDMAIRINNMHTWHTIETAPKDGTSLLLATKSGRIADGSWNQRWGVWAWPYVMVNPTHWMPAPTTPSTER